ncbi:hypothetical protein DVK02_05960 [Halobellus sp. Atlit-31R]|nr:hypothetical protein DVK02_05960 [Halobellus sp. Atlit-31R]
MAALRRVALDILKPHEPSMLDFTDRIAAVESVDGVSASLIELDQEVQNVKITAEGTALEYDAIEEVIEQLGGTVHSVDQAAYGEYVVEERRTPQDD